MSYCWQWANVPKEIARMLSIHRTTVYRHLATIRMVYDVHGNIELMRAILSGLPKNVSQLVLTPRGREVFQLILAGKTSKEIAEIFCISYSGVLRHREKMLEQNDCHSMTELIAKYYNLSPDSLPELPCIGG